jgi:5-methyltetrahydrofolate--homocysteine methyltransferase
MELKKIFDDVVNGEIEAIEAEVPAALAEGVSPDVLLNQALIPAMAEVGRLFEAKEYYIPEMLLSAQAMQTGLAFLRPLLTASQSTSAGKAVFGTVKGDLHDIGKNLVIMMLEGAGFEVTDLGVDVHPDKFVQAVRDGAQVIGLSAMLTTTMPNMAVTIDALKAAGVRDQVVVMVGGAPLTEAYAAEIGADGFSANASAAVRRTKELLAARQHA